MKAVLNYFLSLFVLTSLPCILGGVNLVAHAHTLPARQLTKDSLTCLAPGTVTVQDSIVSRAVGDTSTHPTLQKRVFTSPNVRRAFHTAVKTIGSAASVTIEWAIDMTIQKNSDGTATIAHKLHSVLGIINACEEVKGIQYHDGPRTDGSADVNIKWVLTGTLSGGARVAVTFLTEMFGNAQSFINVEMLDPPVLTINGAQGTMDGGWTWK